MERERYVMSSPGVKLRKTGLLNSLVSRFLYDIIIDADLCEDTDQINEFSIIKKEWLSKMVVKKLF